MLRVLDTRCVGCDGEIIATRSDRTRCDECRKDRRRAKDRRRQKTIRSTPEYRARYRDYILRKKYGIDSSDVEEMLVNQSGCAICGSDSPQWSKGWHVDHDHLTGVVRGILCHKCNLMLGLAGDSASVLRSAASYILGELV